MTTMDIRWEALVVSTDGRGKWQAATVPYLVKDLVVQEGEIAEEALIDYVKSQAPRRLQGLPLESINVEEMYNLSNWAVNVSYGFSSSSTPDQAGESTRAEIEEKAGEDCVDVSADIGAGTTNVIHSFTPPDGDLSDMAVAEGVTLRTDLLINEQADGTALGVDIYSPEMDYSETHIFNNDKMSTSYMVGVLENACVVNNISFRGFEAGEVLFVGASFNRSDADWKVTFRFKIKRNETSISLPGFSRPFEKTGWKYLWVYSKETKTEVGEEISIRSYPIARYIETVYKESDFGFLGIPLD